MHTRAIESRVIVFTDVHHFMQIHEELGERSYDLIQELYEESGEAIVKHGGEIVKYLGDSVFAIFPAGHETEAIECARDMRRAYADLLGRYGVETESELEVGIGSGQVTVGVFGHRTLRTRDAFGRKVSETAMLMHYRGIAISREVFESVGDRYQTRRLADMPLKWQEEPLARWAIVE